MINRNFIDSAENATVTMFNPGLIDPGIIVIARSEIDMESWAPDQTGTVIPRPYPKIKESYTVGSGSNAVEIPTPTLIQYKAESNKFLGYIGDLVEYKFNHIPEKFYYNNIYPLELLNTGDQDYLGSEQPILDAVNKYSVFSELAGSDYKSPESLSPSNYDKFKPRYFGTVVSGDRTVMVFMVPPNYNTVFISNGSGVYSRDDYFAYYGVQLKDEYFHTTYMEAANAVFGYRPSGTYGGGGSTWSGTDMTPTSHVLDEGGNETSVVGYYTDTYVDTTTDPDPDPNPDTGGRGRGNGRGTTTVVSIADGYSLVTNLDLGLDLVIPTNDLYSTEYMEIGDDTNLTLYDYWSPWSNYNFKELKMGYNDGYEFYFKRKTNLTTGSYRYFKIDNLLSNTNNLIDYIKARFRPNNEAENWIDAEQVISKSEGTMIVYRIPIYIKTGNSYRNIRGITKYTYECSTINQYQIYKKVTNYPGDEDDIRDVQCIEFTWDTSKPVSTAFESLNCVPTYGPDKYVLVETESDPSAPTASLGNTFSVKGNITEPVKIKSALVNGNPVLEKGSYPVSSASLSKLELGSTIKVGNKYYAIKETGWFIRENKETQENNPFTPRDNTAHVENNSEIYPSKPVWNNEYGEADYYEYLSNVSQLRIDIREGFEDYYKIVKIIFSSSENQNYSLVAQEEGEVVLALHPGDTVKVGDDILRVDYDWSAPGLPVLGSLTLDHIPLSTETPKFFIGAKIKVEGNGYRLLGYVLNKVSSNEEEAYSAVPGNIVSVSVGSNFKIYSLTAEISPLAIEAVNVVNLGYQTSDNPLKNLDKYLVRDINYIKKYTTTNLGVVDLTSGTYLSPALREMENETFVSFIRYSYRRSYKKGQTALVGLPTELNKNIIDIQAMVPNTERITLDDYSVGSIIYDYSRGKVYQLEGDDDTTSVEDDHVTTEGTYNCNVILTEPYDSNYLFRYRNEYYLLQQDDEGNTELVRVGKLGIRTWISLCDDNRGCLPGTSKNWMSRDGNLSVDDKIWLMITSGNTQRRILGTITKKSSTETQNIGTCVKVACGILGSKVRLNGTEVLVDNHNNIPQEYNGVERYVYDIYMTRTKKINGVTKEIYADITNNLVFRDKINYLSNNYES